MKFGRPNTNQEIGGKNPRAILKQAAMDRHICDRCRSRWVEANQVYCEPCAGKITASYEIRKRKKYGLKRDKNPRWVEVILASDQASKKTVMVSILSDLGTLLTVKGLEAIDIRNALKGKATMQTVRAKPKETAA